MSPSETSKDKSLLEHPNEALNYYRNHGIDKVICQEKHMGSRAIVIVCKDAQAAQKHFNVRGPEQGICYTRTGRGFFNSPSVEQEFISRVAQAITKADLWEELNSDWFCFDCELMPWSAKAKALLEQQYAPVGVAATTGLPESVSLLEKIIGKVDEGQELYQKFKSRSDMAFLYRDAYRRYCWPVEKIDDYKLAPFHVLAYEDSLNLDKDHLWHMSIIERLCEADPHLFQKTAYKVIDVREPASFQEAIDWWADMTARGGEGMVVKPLGFTVRGKQGLIQPGIKCRGQEYLRIIYGPEYTAPKNLERLRLRGLSRKRSLAIREYALGYEALKCFVNKEPFYRVHECVFGILALESEPIDPRL